MGIDDWALFFGRSVDSVRKVLCLYVQLRFQFWLIHACWRETVERLIVPTDEPAGNRVCWKREVLVWYRGGSRGSPSQVGRFCGVLVKCGEFCLEALVYWQGSVRVSMGWSINSGREN